MRDLLLLAAAGFLTGFLLVESLLAPVYPAEPLDEPQGVYLVGDTVCVDLWHWTYSMFGLPDDCEWTVGV